MHAVYYFEVHNILSELKQQQKEYRAAMMRRERKKCRMSFCVFIFHASQSFIRIPFLTKDHFIR